MLCFFSAAKGRLLWHDMHPKWRLCKYAAINNELKCCRCAWKHCVCISYPHFVLDLATWVSIRLKLTFFFCTQGKYCPTTCGVADYLLNYLPGVNQDLDDMLYELERITNLTEVAVEKVDYMKDSAASAQKNSQSGNSLCLELLELQQRKKSNRCSIILLL